MSPNPSDPYIARVAQELSNESAAAYARGEGEAGIRAVTARLADRYSAGTVAQAAKYMVKHRVLPA